MNNNPYRVVSDKVVCNQCGRGTRLSLIVTKKYNISEIFINDWHMSCKDEVLEFDEIVKVVCECGNSGCGDDLRKLLNQKGENTNAQKDTK